MDNAVTFETGGEELLDDIKELWEQLNQLHLEKSPFFKSHYRTFTFDARKQALLSCARAGRLFICVAYDKDIKIGYCVASVVGNTGEVDSIYVKPDYRRTGIGSALMEKSLDRIKSNNAGKIIVKVAFGNEEAFGFYSKYGFAPRLTELQMKDE